jgi:subtilisin family serine protease
MGGEGARAARAVIETYGGMNTQVVDEFGIGEMSTYLVHGPRGLRAKLSALSDVALIEHDIAMHASGDAVEDARAPSSAAPTWGLERISQPELASAPYTYRYPSSAGAGVNIYVIDTGIPPDLPEFEGRARIGWSAFGTVAVPLTGTNRELLGKSSTKWGRKHRAPLPSHLRPSLPVGTDENGHARMLPEHAGMTYGVAKAASIVSAAVAAGLSGVIAGIQWVVNQHASMYGVAVDGSTAGAA